MPIALNGHAERGSDFRWETLPFSQGEGVAVREDLHGLVGAIASLHPSDLFGFVPAASPRAPLAPSFFERPYFLLWEWISLIRG